MMSREQGAGSGEQGAGSREPIGTTLAPWQVPSFIRHVERHQSLPSTNDRALELAASSEVELPALVVADHQTAGRGRGGHSWWSADGALTFSLLLDASDFGITPRDWPKLSLATAVAVCDVLLNELRFVDKRAGDPAPGKTVCRVPASPPTGLVDEPARYDQFPYVGIKWPNDVLVGGRKVGGVLIESPGGGALAKGRLVVGVGVNVNNAWREAPPAAGNDGTALCDVTGKRHDVHGLLTDFLDAFGQRLQQLSANDPRLSSTWQQLSWLTGRNVAVDTMGHPITGRCHAVADDGALLIDSASGRQRVYSGSVRVIP